MTQKKIIIPIAAIVLLTGLFANNTQVYAQTPTTTNNGNFFSNMMHGISERFGHHDYRQVGTNSGHRMRRRGTPPSAEEMQKKQEDRLTTLVSDGKITEVQKQLILEKVVEFKTARQADKQDMTKEERKIDMDKKRQELEAWAKTNGIDMQYLLPQHKGKWEGMRK
ncbi:hypothetical protein BH09PAT2_BH09PAT2_01590 [soil metagenome]